MNSQSQEGSNCKMKHKMEKQYLRIIGQQGYKWKQIFVAITQKIQKVDTIRIIIIR